MSEPRAARSLQLSLLEVQDLMEQAAARGRVGLARKTRPVDARPARRGEVIVTRIAGEAPETRSRPAREGDWVVRNRSARTGNEEYLVSGPTFEERYRLGRGTTKGGWREARPVGKAMRFFRVGDQQGPFVFEAPWGEAMTAAPGDAIVQDPEDPADLYRVAKAAFEATYEVLEGARAPRQSLPAEPRPSRRRGGSSRSPRRRSRRGRRSRP